jgi:hypothetical protein
MNPRLPWPAAAACAFGLLGLPAHAAEPACAPLVKAVRAGLAQQRIHAAIDMPLDAEALKMGMKPTLMHSIVIGPLQHSNAMTPKFRATPLKTAAERDLASDLAAFEAEAGCQFQGQARLAGRDALRYGFATNLGRGEARVTLWVDAGTGLPLRAVSDEPDVDVDTGFRPAAGGGRKFEVKEKPNGKRLVATHAYLFGDAVKPPDARGAVDPAALARLQALLQGAP